MRYDPTPAMLKLNAGMMNKMDKIIVQFNSIASKIEHPAGFYKDMIH